MIRLANRLFGTQPVLAHAPGPLYPCFQRLCESTYVQPKRHVPCPDVTVLTWHTGPRAEKPCGVFERSLAQLGIEPLVLGRDAKDWKNIHKLRITAEALQTVKTPYVLGADSCDVLLFDSPAVIADRFRRHFTCDLVFNSTGSRCWPELPEFIEFESQLPWAAIAHGRHWLNAGVWFGRTEFCREYFAALAATPPVAGFEVSEQAVVKREWPKWYPRVQLDYLCQLFQWINEDRKVVDISRTLVPRQTQLLQIVRPLGQNLIGAEVGVFDGTTSAALLSSLSGLRLWMVDPWRKFQGACSLDALPQSAFDAARESALWWTEPASDRRFVLREESIPASRRFADQSLDFVFIDGNHLYEHVRDDIAAWWPKVRSGGICSGHDYGVYRDAENVWGVRRAVDEFAARQNRKVQVGQDGVWWMMK